MKTHLALMAASVVLSSHAAFAASEGGDTWSELQPQPFVRSIQPLALPAPARVGNQQRVYRYGAPGGSEGGDTWSELQPQPYAPSTQSPAVATIAPLSSLQHETLSGYGAPAQADSADRVVQLGPDSHWINVAYGETVEFVVNGESGARRSFAWRFEVSPALSHVDLRNVAPADFPAQNVRVFVAPDSRYRGG